MTSPLTRLPRVVDVAPTTVERDAPLPVDAARVAVVANWSPGTQQRRSTTRLIAELQRLGYRVVVCSTSKAAAPLDFTGDDDVRLDELVVLRRPNEGYDFGSWATALARYEHVLDCDKVLLVNDSLVGPFIGLDQVIAHFEETSADVWGMVESDQFTSHLQSYFRGFRHGALAEPPLREFWSDLRVVPDKTQLIEHYEFGFAAFLQQHAFTSTAFVHHGDVVRAGLNPTIHGWRRLLEAGVPFVKRELVRSPGLAADGHLLPRYVQDHYGVDVTDW